MVKKRSAFMGPRLRRLRRDLGLTQAIMAEDLGVSPSYIALMERNQRPMTADIILRMAATYRLDVASLASDKSEHFEAELATALRDPLFSDLELASTEVEDVVNSFPATADAFMRLYTAYQEGQLALADRGAGDDTEPDPTAEARRFLSVRRNTFPAIDDEAETLAKRISSVSGMEGYVHKRGLKVRRLPPEVMAESLRRFNQHRNEIAIDERLDKSSYNFQLALQIAYMDMKATISAILAETKFNTENGQRLTRRALGNYAAGAILMPYQSFLKTAEALRYDLEALSRRFGVSFEQVAHRLTTLQKPGQEGVPFFFIRVDAAGNVSKRLDGAGFPFARHGGSCPLWSLHQAFRAPRTILTEWIELPDGERFFSIVRTVTAGGGAFGAASIERAVALGCPARYAERLIYAKENSHLKDAPTQIGVSCRLCHRSNCIARAELPIGRKILTDDYRRAIGSFGLADHSS